MRERELVMIFIIPQKMETAALYNGSSYHNMLCVYLLPAVPFGFGSMTVTWVSDSNFIMRSTAYSFCLNSLAILPGKRRKKLYNIIL